MITAKLINNELSEKEKNLKKLRSENKNLVNQLRNSISYLDSNYLFTFINNINDKKITKVKNVHYEKLFNLGLQHEVTRLNPNDLIFNYSKKVLSEEEIEALSHGLKFGLPPKSNNYSRWFLVFEKALLEIERLQFSC